MTTKMTATEAKAKILALLDALVGLEDWDALRSFLPAARRRAAELALRARYAGVDAAAIEVVPNLERALDRGLELTPPGGELVILPTYTAMLALRKVAVGRGLVRPYWERAA